MNAIWGLVQHPAAHRVGWALVHSVWQGAVVACLFAMLRSALHLRSAGVRYRTACAMLFLLAALPFATLLVGPSMLVSSPPAEPVPRLNLRLVARSAGVLQATQPQGSPSLVGWQALELLDELLS